MKQLFVIIVILFQFTIYSQTVLLHEDVSKLDFQMPSSGPNYKNFHQLYLNYSFIIPFGDNLEVEMDMWKSASFSVGWRYKRKLASWFAVGTGISYTNPIYSITQNANKQVPNNIQHKEEKIRLNNVNLELYTRINFGKRGNVIGKFIDIGGYAEYAFSVKHFYEDDSDKSNPPYYSGVTQVNERDLNYINRFNYGLKTRLGINRWVIIANYRLSNLLTDDYKSIVGNYFLPRFAVGVEVGLHK